ncbi:TPA: DUF2845 domain-containing protein [Legionella pneumophila]|nr:DUF2845 domain-containing protein [Legionella pneumophila]MDW8880634.1 DUF2845 domain-containing protein [Legionella pneumophila subsp. fraseri]MDW8962250.1 DUF2845 domain-containing protein [Legionella pneumophila subsp. fraseri]MDW9034756.1 DUF2845 domain-containing protein [Legionella pneumophila subsp. fraseri]MDW9037568.1 DUF2845 domain-containing protein [Legionella pneumophila subsp. fraseri]MDW9040877.1 DUF2845 domain-containing protein [Legionella pneumophila subsp. fraseri]
MKLFISLCITLFTLNAFSYSNFDKMRCKGELIEAGMNLYTVKELCGEPLFEKEDTNPFRTFHYLTYKAEGASSRYYLLFKNEVLIGCKFQGYNAGDFIWHNPNTLN